MTTPDDMTPNMQPQAAAARNEPVETAKIVSDKPEPETDNRSARQVAIGHDVWIGHGAVVMPGVAIGNGAVIGANAVVTRDVAAYAIVAGSPARPLRQRFPAGIAGRIEALAWWDWPVEKLAQAVPDMQTMPIEAFLERWEGRPGSP